VNLVVLAGDRGPDDPVAVQAAVSGKTLARVAGVPMLTRVLSTLSQWPMAEKIVVVAPATNAYQVAVKRAAMPQPFDLIAPRPSPSLSVSAALEAFDDQRPVTLLTADHPLLKLEWLDTLSGPGDDDLRVGLVDHALVQARFPESRRTRYRFADRALGGTNLFQFRTSRADAILETWRRVEQERKKPWKVVSLLGASNLLRYAVGRLHSEQAFAALSERIGIKIGYRLISDPLAAVDIDSVADLELVESLLERDRFDQNEPDNHGFEQDGKSA